MYKWTLWALLPLPLAALAWDLLISPDDALLGPSQRIFYIHMGCAVGAALAFTVTALASLAYLIRRQSRYDAVAAASAEIGTMLTTIVLATGVLWGRVAWGIWWTWDPRLTTTLILWLLFAGYLMLRQTQRGHEVRARTSAVLALVFYVDVPIDYMSIRWWNSIHPIVITSQGVNMAPAMVAAMLITIAMVGGLYAVWLPMHVRLATLADKLREIKQMARLRSQNGLSEERL
jgi:heme exporter protein C